MDGPFLVLEIDHCSYHSRETKDILGGSKIRGTKKGPNVQNLCDFCDLGFLQYSTKVDF